MDASASFLLRGYPAWLFKAFVACYTLLCVAALGACSLLPGLPG